MIDEFFFVLIYLYSKNAGFVFLSSYYSHFHGVIQEGGKHLCGFTTQHPELAKLFYQCTNVNHETMFQFPLTPSQGTVW